MIAKILIAILAVVSIAVLLGFLFFVFIFALGCDIKDLDDYYDDEF